MLARDPAMHPSAAELLNHERVRFASKTQNLLIREFELKERESAIHDALQNKNVERREREIGGIVQRKEQETMEAFRRREMELLEREEAKSAEIRLLQTKVHQYEAQLQISGPAAMQAALTSREREIYVIVQRKEAEIMGAFGRRERELVETLEERDEALRLLRQGLEELVARFADGPVLDAVRTILTHQRPTSPMEGVILTATSELIRTPSPENPNFEQVDYGANSTVAGKAIAANF
ncbi:hypothetical protein B0H13DRAFT_2308289 [Mycena leptocephala]|nr:hypothetical protein B0H13DRAFT_2308289 [Mycena leptocephala]